jgi:hypothetical protein
MVPPAVRFSVIGLNHNHIYSQSNLLLRAGAKLVSFFAEEPDLAAEFARRYPEAPAGRRSAPDPGRREHPPGRQRRHPV